MREIREVNPVIYHGCENWKIKNSKANRTDAYPDKRFRFLEELRDTVMYEEVWVYG